MDNTNGVSNRDRSRSPRERPQRRDRRRSGSQDRGRERPVRRGGLSERRVQISNIPYEFRWQELKDLFRDEVGEVAFVEIFDSPKGTGIIEFNSPDLARKAIEKMHRFEVRGRKLVVKEDTGEEQRRPRSPRRNNNNMNNNNNNNFNNDGERGSRWSNNNDRNSPPSEGWGFTYGLSPAFLESLDVKGPLVNRVFVANLDYKVDDKKLEEVFGLAGKIIRAEINKDRDGKSRGHGVVVFDHPVESVQAISMFHQQTLFDRSLIVRMDRVNDKPENNMPRLPEGLKGIGMGLGENGRPLTDVSRSIPMNVQNAQIQNMNMTNQMNTMGGGGGPGPGMGGAAPNMGMGAMNMASLTGLNFPGVGPNVPNLNNMLPGNLIASLSSGNLSGLLSALGQSGSSVDIGSLTGGMGPSGGMGPTGGIGPSGGMGPTGGMGPSGGMGSGGMVPTGGMGPTGVMGPTGGMGSSGGMGQSGPMGGAGLAGSAPSSNMGSSMGSSSALAAYNTGSSGAYSSGPSAGSAMGNTGGSGISSSGYGATPSYGSNNSGGGGGGFGNSGATPGTGSNNYSSNSVNSSQNFGSRASYEVGGSPYQGYNTSPMNMEGSSANKQDQSDTIVIRNLPPTVTWQALRDKFREFGDVKFAEIRNKDTGFVRFSNGREALRAANAMNRTRVEGRNIEVALF